MPKVELDYLQSVKLGDVWENEPDDFTPWLAEEESLKQLGETLGMELELEGQELPVGNFRADILCRNTIDGSRVLIENQLMRTDHTHLGQILTYAAGLDIHTVIWIAKEFREEHRAALDRLNEITDENFQWFGVEIKVWRIGDSKRAPQFEILSKPNDWKRTTAKRSERTTIADKDIQQKEKYWSKLREYLQEIGGTIRIGKSDQGGNFVFISIGRTGFRLKLSLSTAQNQISVVLDMFNLKAAPTDAEADFKLLRQQREDIDPHFDGQLEWEDDFNRVALYKNDVDPMDKIKWREQHNWFASNLEKFDEVFRPRIKALNPADRQPVEEDVQVFSDSE